MAAPIDKTGYTRMLRERLRAARIARGMTQEDVATEIARRTEEPLGGSAVSNWEKMLRHPRIDRFAAWARAVGMRLIVDLEPEGSQRIPVMLGRDTAELAKAIDRLPPEKRAAIQVVVDQLMR